MSGFSGLIYQVAWQRLLTLHYGVGAVSISLIVSVYMLGLGLGSLFGGRFAERCRDPYALYALVEGGLSLAGFVSFPLILALGRFASNSTLASSFLWIFAFLCLPTFLMGITLPLLTIIFVRITGDFIHCVSRLYFINTMGAASGAALTSYILTPLFGLNGCIYFAAVTDLILAAAILIARRTARQVVPPDPPEETATCNSSKLVRLSYVLVFAAGFVAIGYEIIWYRIIGVLIKDSPYAFSSVLSVYLAGVAFGSLGIQKYLADKPTPSNRDLFFTIQFLIGFAVLLIIGGYYYLSKHGPVGWLTHLSFSTDLHPSLALFMKGPGQHSFKDAFLLLDVFLWPLAFLFVPTILMGASFPLIASLALTRRGGEGSALGTTYFFGVLGNVAGGLLTGLVLLPAAGTETTLLGFGILGLLFGLAPQTIGRRQLSFLHRLTFVLVLVLGAILLFPLPGELYTTMHEAPFAPSRISFEEGLDAVVLTYENGSLLRNFINGQGHGYQPGPLFIAEAIEGLSFADSPRRILIIGFGAGSITEAALIPAEVQQVTVVELCPSSIRNLKKFPAVAHILDNERLRLVIDDGRRFLRRTTDQFDLVLMDPLRTTTAYSNNLHSRQFFALAAQHLVPGGILMVGGVGDSLVIPRTLLEEFAYVRACPSFSLASKTPFRQNRDRLEELLATCPVDVRTTVVALERNAMEGNALLEAIAGYPVNQDWRPESEYYLGLLWRSPRNPARMRTEK